MREFSPEVIEKLGHYVYLYVDPLTNQVFYVGKGFGNRVFAHVEDPADSDKVRRIQELRRAGMEPQLEILVHGLDTETAYRVEAAVIDLFSRENLTNRVRGWRSGGYGRMSVDHIEALYAATPVEIDVPAILIRINELFRYGMSAIELYDTTPGIWKIGNDRTKAKFAMAVFEGVVQEVYEIQGWFPAGSTLSTRGELKDESRWEFVGHIAEDSVRSRYRMKSVRRYFPQGAQNPVRYVNVRESI